MWFLFTKICSHLMAPKKCPVKLKFFMIQRPISRIQMGQKWGLIPLVNHQTSPVKNKSDVWIFSHGQFLSQFLEHPHAIDEKFSADISEAPDLGRKLQLNPPGQSSYVSLFCQQILRCQVVRPQLLVVNSHFTQVLPSNLRINVNIITE